ncbi:MAG: uroporphyrinogen-III synthase [Gaiellaceae bacterium]
MRILLTGTRAEPLRTRLAQAGHEVLVCPLVRVEPVGEEPVDVDGYDWVVVTSVTGAEELKRRLRGRPRRVAAIGAATAEAFGGADLVPAVSTQEGLLAELPRPAGRVLFAGAEGARTLLADELGADVVTLYRTVELRPDLPAADVAVLASASAARALGSLGAGLPAVSIGPQTTSAARAAGVRIVAEAKTHDVEGLVEACSSLS